jgi:glycosyltransferase involved in cell wall biosynthesis
MTASVGNSSYVLITSARNEESYIGSTIQAVISQTVLPARWVVVSDGSTDMTDDIVAGYASSHGFIHLVRQMPSETREFGSKVRAINRAYELLKDMEFSFIGNLDADVTFGSSYYESILNRFHENRRLGIAGGICLDTEDATMNRHLMSRDEVRGAVQLFRRSCYEEIGGYLVLPMGGIDTVAQIMARMHGWEVRSFGDQQALHHRRTGTAGISIHKARFREGMKHYYLGYHPVFMAAKCAHRMIDPPYIAGSALMLAGYLWANLRGEDRRIPAQVIDYSRKCQVLRMKTALGVKVCRESHGSQRTFS